MISRELIVLGDNLRRRGHPYMAMLWDAVVFSADRCEAQFDGRPPRMDLRAATRYLAWQTSENLLHEVFG